MLPSQHLDPGEEVEKPRLILARGEAAMIFEDLLEKLLSADIGETIEDLDGNSYVVYRARNGCRFVRIEGDKILMEQNKNKDSRFALMARRGRKIGWVIPRQGRWRLVMVKEATPPDDQDFRY